MVKVLCGSLVVALAAP
nr:hypothetical protein [Vibrio metschnikovii]